MNFDGEASRAVCVFHISTLSSSDSLSHITNVDDEDEDDVLSFGFVFRLLPQTTLYSANTSVTIVRLVDLIHKLGILFRFLSY